LQVRAWKIESPSATIAVVKGRAAGLDAIGEDAAVVVDGVGAGDGAADVELFEHPPIAARASSVSAGRASLVLSIPCRCGDG
jgi:hypothetical protein